RGERRDEDHHDSPPLSIQNSTRKQRKSGPRAGGLRREMPGLPVGQRLHRVPLGSGDRGSIANDEDQGVSPSIPSSLQSAGNGAVTVIGSYLIGCRNVKLRAWSAMMRSRGSSAGGPNGSFAP